MASTSKHVALVHYPESQHYVAQTLAAAFGRVCPDWQVISTRGPTPPDLEWCDYDALEWDAQQSNSYCIRKALIRKNHLAHTIALYTAKNPKSCLAAAAPRTFTFNLAFPDELDELLQDELYELGEAFEDGSKETWWILKAALADRGNGIRLFSTRRMLEDIFDEFEVESDDEDEDGEESTGYGQGKETAVDASQMREWTIQEYMSTPLLLDPILDGDAGRKFHLRVYVLAVGGLTVYIHRPFLALFAPTKYSFPPTETPEGKVDLSAHLTNTCLQTAEGEEPSPLVVSTLHALSQHMILSGPAKGEQLGGARVQQIEEDVGNVVGELFRAAISSGSGFQARPNCFEIFGLDFLVDDDLQVTLLEVNACPDFGQTGDALQSVIEDLFSATLKTAVLPFFAPQDDATYLVSDVTRLRLDSPTGLKQVLDMSVSRGW